MLLSAWVSRSGFGAVISCSIVRNCIVCCNAASANRSVVAASKFLGATAVCVCVYYDCLLQLNIVNRIGMAA